VRAISAARNVSLKDAYLRYWLRWSDYHGRSSRQEYWKWFLVNAVIGIVLSVIVSSIGASWIVILFELANLVPATTLAIRRLHDAGHTGKWMIPLLVCDILLLALGSITATSSLAWLAIAVLLASMIFGIVVFVFLLQRSKPDNAWGMEPR
jgi:uncharacterized membrane protein YhaH (DUF805 family)